MQLKVTSDAGYANCFSSFSRYGGHFSLGDSPNEAPNGAIHIATGIMKHVCTSAFEAEMSAIFENVRKVIDLKQALENFGYPQKSIEVRCDNQSTVNVFHGFAQMKHSHSLNMRYWWVMQQIKLNLVHIQWSSGKSNLADFFTKLLANQEFNDSINMYVVTTSEFLVHSVRSGGVSAFIGVPSKC